MLFAQEPAPAPPAALAPVAHDASAPASIAPPDAPPGFLYWLGTQLTLPIEDAITANAEASVVAVEELNHVKADLGAVREEVAGLRKDMMILQETLDLILNRIMADLQAENDLLREEMQRMYTRRESGLPEPAGVPRPGGAIMEEIAAEAPDEEEEAPTPQKPTGPFSFSIVKEWGRSPEAAAELGGNVTTLKGIVGTVPAGASSEDLEQLGRDLRQEYDAYDNIRIDVFDDLTAAQEFLEQEAAAPPHLVLRVSRFKASGRDVILLTEDGSIREVNF